MQVADAPAEAEDDPLEAFMAGIAEEVKADKPTAKAKPKAGIELDDDDNVADFLEVRIHSTSSPFSCPIAVQACTVASRVSLFHPQ